MSRSPLKALGQVPPQPRKQWKLQRDLAPESAVGALRQPHDRHAAGAELAHQLIRADPLARLQARRQHRGRAGRAATAWIRLEQAEVDVASSSNSNAWRSAGKSV